jgi:hypothetical protein
MANKPRTISDFSSSLPFNEGPEDGGQRWAEANISFTALAPANYDAITMAYDGSGNLTSVLYSLNGVTLSTLSLLYDGSGNLAYVKRV